VTKDFPVEELKSWRRISDLLDYGVYFAYGYYEGEVLKAYGFFVHTGTYALLDYFAVKEEMRGTGVGSACLLAFAEELKEQGYALFLVESEDPKFGKTKEDKETRKRRIRFYEKNGLLMSKTRATLFGVNYRILYRPLTGECSEKEADDALIKVYWSMFPEKYKNEIHVEKNS
jgi:GNAT superfamily N-acetyltransferase